MAFMLRALFGFPFALAIGPELLQTVHKSSNNASDLAVSGIATVHCARFTALGSTLGLDVMGQNEARSSGKAISQVYQRTQNEAARRKC